MFDDPQHPYTVGLLRSLPRHGIRKTERALSTIPGILPLIGSRSADVRVRRPLPAGRRDVPHRGAARRAGRRRRRLGTPAATTPTASSRSTRPSRASTSRMLAAGRRPARRARAEPRVEDVPASAATTVPALVDVELGLAEGETLGIVGESGSGKSTLAKTMLGIESADTGGAVSLDGHAVAAGDRSARRPSDKRSMQMVFQNPDSALNRAGRCGASCMRSVDEAHRHQGRGGQQAGRGPRRAPAAHAAPPRPQAAPAVGRPEAARRDRPRLRRRPAHRGVRRAHRALDVSVQAAILNLLADLQSEQTHQLRVHHPRHGRGALPGRSHRGDVPRSHPGGRAHRRRLRRARTTRTPRRCCRPSRASTARHEGAHPSRRRDPEPGQPAVGVRVPHALPSRASMGICDVTEPPLAEVSPGPRDAVPHPGRAAHRTAAQAGLTVDGSPAEPVTSGRRRRRPGGGRFGALLPVRRSATQSTKRSMLVSRVAVSHR